MEDPQGARPAIFPLRTRSLKPKDDCLYSKYNPSLKQEPKPSGAVIYELPVNTS